MLGCPVCRSKYPDGTASCPNDGSALLPEEAFAAADALIQAGTMIGEYRVERKLGEGSFGAVYAGVQPLIGKKVAIKVLHKKMSSEPEIVARFIGEARAVNRIGHPNIIDVFSFGIHGDGQHYFVMELCEGMTLAALCEEKGRLDLATALPILRGIADGLDAAHAAGVTHRDLKPDNVFLARRKDGAYSPKLLDFGVAKLGGEEGAQKTATGVAIGTPRYMSPEQSRGKKIDHRADIYSLGVVAHELLTGKPLFEADSVVDLLFKHATEAPPPMSSVCSAVPKDLDAAVLAMLAKRPSARPDSAGAAIAALESKARELAASATVAAAVQAPDGAASGEEAPPKDGGTTGELHAAKPAITTGELEAEKAAAGTVEMPVTPTGTVLGEPIPGAGSTDMAAVQTITAPTMRTITTPGITSAPAEPGPAPRGISARIAVGALAAAAIVAALFFSRAGREAEQAPGAATTGSARIEAPAAISSTVTIQFAVMPADARLRLDGKESGLASDPLVIARSKTERAFQIERAGYETQILWIRPDEDKSIGPISLTPRAPGSASAEASGAASAGPAKGPVKSRMNKALEMPAELGGSK